MMLLTMNTYLSLLWGISVLFSLETKSASIPENNTSISTAEPNNATTQQNTLHVLHYETETQHATQDPTHKPAKISAVATAEAAVSPTMEIQKANVSSMGYSSNVSTTGLVVVNTAAATASSLPQMLTSASKAQPSHNTMTSETARPTEDQQSPTASTKMTAPATTFAVMSTSSAASLATAAVSSPQPTSTTVPEVTPKLSFTTSSDHLTQAPHFIQNLSTASASTMATNTTNLTSEVAPVFNPTSLPVRKTETATTSSELSSTSQPISDAQSHTSTPKFPDTTRSRSTIDFSTMSASTDSVISTTAFSTSTVGVLIHHVTHGLPISTTKSIATTTAKPQVNSQSPITTEVQPCSTRGVVKHCLIVIASLAGVATIFMVSTIVLCTKLSARKYKVRKPQQGTEMICISSLLPERNYTYTRQRNPVSNGVRVIPTGGDSDEDVGDNLTLSSFLPENDRNV